VGSYGLIHDLVWKYVPDYQIRLYPQHIFILAGLVLAVTIEVHLWRKHK
jgi:hypothetical protein